ncbi:YheC/YheD family endospore coat-associated protein [Alkalihalobacterium elongatum]|uniref:YheC/YheD family endospore coat-associated protein n=1 Tax=Alkalihalobacterium elongatum TaxID=2675466 RepID=UPI001C201244|nr:YheC/YheD family protein [Alkalihalobacterium elongatum]
MEKYNFTQPIIGICVSDQKVSLRTLVKERINCFDGKATFVIFYLSDLDFNSLSVRGKYLEDKEGEWKEGTLPFPDVIYLQSRVDLKIVKKMENVIGRKVFNTFTLDKFTEAKLLEEHKILQRHLPYSQKLESESQLQTLLTTYKNIFLKPIFGASSKGVIRVTLHPTENIEVHYGTGRRMRVNNFSSIRKFWKWLMPRLSKNTYLMQQGIQTMKWNGKATDIRLNLNRNKCGIWEVSALLFRIASNNSHLIPGPTAIIPINNLTNLKYDIKKVEEMERSIKELGYKICHALDLSGHHMADLGLDLGMDESGHLWIFEVNSLPHPIRIKDDHSLTLPLDYAFYLASKE